jgi:hypothetical protein
MEDRDDEDWQNYVEERKEYEAKLHAHNKLLEYSITKNSSLLKDAIRKPTSPKASLEKSTPQTESSMVEYLLGKMEFENAMEAVKTKGENRRVAVLQPRDSPAIFSTKNGDSRPVSAPAKYKPLFPALNSPHLRRRSPLRSGSTDSVSSHGIGVMKIGGLFNYCDKQSEDLSEMEPPKSKIFRCTTLNLRSNLTIHDRWVNHYLEEFEVLHNNVTAPYSGLRQMKLYKQDEHRVIRTVLESMVSTAARRLLKQRLFSLLGAFLALHSEENLLLINELEALYALRRCRGEIVVGWTTDWFENRILQPLLRLTFQNWKYYSQACRRYSRGSMKLLQNRVQSQHHTRFRQFRNCAIHGKIDRNKIESSTEIFEVVEHLKSKLLVVRNEVESLQEQTKNAAFELDCFKTEETDWEIDYENAVKNKETYRCRLATERVTEEYTMMALEDRRGKLLRKIRHHEKRVVKQLIRYSKLQKTVDDHVEAKRKKGEKKQTKRKPRKKKKTRLKMRKQPKSPEPEEATTVTLPLARSMACSWDQIRFHAMRISCDFVIKQQYTDFSEFVPCSVPAGLLPSETPEFNPPMILQDSPTLMCTKINGLFDKRLCTEIHVTTDNGEMLELYPSLGKHDIIPSFVNNRVFVYLSDLDVAIRSLPVETTAPGIIEPIQLCLFYGKTIKKDPVKVTKIEFRVKRKRMNRLRSWLVSPKLPAWDKYANSLNEKACANSNILEVVDKIKSLVTNEELKEFSRLKKPSKAALLCLTQTVQGATGILEVSGGWKAAQKQIKNGVLLRAVLSCNLMHVKSTNYVEEFLGNPSNKIKSLFASPSIAVKLLMEWIVAVAKWRKTMLKLKPVPSLSHV